WIVQETQPTTVVCSPDALGAVAAAIASVPSVRGVVVMDIRAGDHAQEAALARAREVGLALDTMVEVERLGRRGGPLPPFEEVSGDALQTLVYTSGSTGSPKGAMFPARVWAQQWQTLPQGPLALIPHVSVQYVPLNHVAGRSGIA